ncbi:hypothetical protein P7K49_006205, partial [Saguinus oedipus]
MRIVGKLGGFRRGVSDRDGSMFSVCNHDWYRVDISINALEKNQLISVSRTTLQLEVHHFNTQRLSTSIALHHGHSSSQADDRALQNPESSEKELMLSLANNHIKALPRDVFSDLDSLIELDLRGNKFECDCKAKWLYLWLKMTNSTVSDVLCISPPEYQEKKLNDELKRHQNSKNKYPIEASPATTFQQISKNPQ